MIVKKFRAFLCDCDWVFVKFRAFLCDCEEISNMSLSSSSKFEADSELLCKCGVSTVIRRAKKDKNRGKLFYGCSKYKVIILCAFVLKLIN